MYGDDIPQVIWVHRDLVSTPEGLERVAWMLGRALQKAPVVAFIPPAAGLPTNVYERGESYAHLADDPTVANISPWNDQELTVQALLVQASRMGAPLAAMAESERSTHKGSGLVSCSAEAQQSLPEAWEWAASRGAQSVELWMFASSQVPLTARMAVPHRMRYLDREEAAMVSSGTTSS